MVSHVEIIVFIIRGSFFEVYGEKEKSSEQKKKAYFVEQITLRNSQEFKEDAVRYRLEHPEIALRKCAENLGISESALKTWMKSAKEHEGTVPIRGSGNYASDEAKEIARLQRELRDTKDALEVLKKQSVFQENDKNSLRCYI